MKLKIALFLVHRWVGVSMCLFFAMWFFSGMVMMYVGYPELTVQERYAGTSRLDSDKIHYSPSDLFESFGLGFASDRLILTNIGNRPAYLLAAGSFQQMAIYADTGEYIELVSSELAVELARSFYRNQHGAELISGVFRETLEMDQWSISGGLSPHRPLHLVSIEDAAGTNLYVSSLTGQVVLDTTRRERVWNWLGANIHWIYPIKLRKHTNTWVNIIIVLSLIGLMSLLTGAIIGVIRLRIKSPYRGKYVTPYRGIAKYHHIVGLASLIFLVTFMFSGLMSIGPWGIFDSDTSYGRQLGRYQYSDDSFELDLAFSEASDLQQLLKQPENQTVKQIVWHRINGKSYVAMYDAPDAVRVSSSIGDRFDLALRIKESAPRLIPESNILELEELEGYDTYYYSHHSRFRPLPILRVKYDDPESTWFHIDLESGQLVGRMTSANRVQRWMFNGLHSLDFSTLINNRPFWDIVVILLCSLGLAFSITSVVVSWRRIRKKVAK